MSATKWSLAQIWNEAALKENKPLVKRNYVYASEMGMPFYDRYLKMKGVAYTNPPNNRSLRKFLAGNIWEHTVKQILIATGVYRREEVKVDATPYDGLLSVHGRLDFIAGGRIDGQAALERLAALNLPDYLVVVGEKIIKSLEGGELEKKIIELKAVSTFAMDKVENMGKPMPNNSLQGFHYQHNSKIPANVVYICKDDCRMQEFGINAVEIEPIYREDLEKMTYYYTNNKKPPLDPLAKFDTMLGKFSKNLGVEWSPYLSHYGFETPDEFRGAVKFVDSWNRVLLRLVQVELGFKTPAGKPISITPKNKDVIADIQKAGYNIDSLVNCRIAVGDGVEDNEETE